MKTPICDFVKNYIDKKAIRLHVPGHKGKGYFGFEKYDLTEIDGADDLYTPSGIILESENNASKLFCHPTFYSTEGSSHGIRAMVYLTKLHALNNNKKPIILSFKNVHKSFITAVALLDVEVLWFENNNLYLSNDIDFEFLDNYLFTLKEKPCAFYITSPSYLGQIVDVKKLSNICHKYNILLIVDNAHGSYLKFLESDCHPISLGADMCVDSAHKTLPVLTGGAYIHLSNTLDKNLIKEVKTALCLFGSTSPSYLILQSLDNANKIISVSYAKKLNCFVKKLSNLKSSLQNYGYKLFGNEPLKLTIMPKCIGYTGLEFVKLLKENNIYVEFYDSDYVVMMFSLNFSLKKLSDLKKVLLSIKKKQAITITPPTLTNCERVLDIKTALFKQSEIVDVDDSENRIYAEINTHCPPAVPIILIGEKITQQTIEVLKYYNISKIKVIKE